MCYVIGVDGGSESLRAFVFDLEGRPRGSHATAYKTDFPQRRSTIVEPDRRRTQLYEREIYPRYRALYGALKAVRSGRWPPDGS